MNSLYKFNNLLSRMHGFLFLLIILTLFFILRLPSLFEPYWYGDEGIYHVIGDALRNGKMLYKDIWDNKPPLLYLLYAILFSDQFLIRLASLFFGIGSVIAFYVLSRKLFIFNYPLGSKHNGLYIAYATTFCFAVLFGTPLLEGNIANSENFMLLPIIVSGIYLFNYLENKQNRSLIIAGVLLAIAFLFKAVGIFDFLAFSIFLIIKTYKEKPLLDQLKKIFPFFLSFFLPFFLISLFFAFAGTLTDFFNAVFRQNVDYVGYANQLLIPQGLLILKIFVLLTFIYFLFKKRHSLTTSALFIFLWFSFSTFNAFFSGRPFTHYMLVLLPSFLFLLGFIFWKPIYLKKEGSKTIFAASQKLGGIMLIVVFWLLWNHFWFYEKIVPYYQNFISFITMEKSVTAYRAFFDKNTPKDYELAQFINRVAKPDDNIFVWGNNAQLYTLTKKLPPGRYIVTYHITSSKTTLQETKQALYKTKPRFIIVTSKNNSIPYNLANYRLKIDIRDTFIYERIF